MISKELLLRLVEKHHIPLDETALTRFDQYAELLVEWNEKINLTSITDPEGIVYKHFLDSLLLLEQYDLPEGSSLIDVGTGAGFPGLALKIARPDLQVTLLDGTLKRLNVIRDIQEHLELTTELVHLRAEDAGRDPKYREQFDFATARAVTELRNLSELCIPFLKVGGTFLAMKGPGVEEEIKEAGNAIALLGAKRQPTKSYELESFGERNLVIATKQKPTPSKYPRPMAKIRKEPLGRKNKT